MTIDSRPRLARIAHSSDVDDTLSNLNRCGWWIVAYGDRSEPDLLIAYQRLGSDVDVLITAGEDRSAAYRAPAWPDEDPIFLEKITWHYLGSIQPVLRNLLRLPAEVDRSWPTYPRPSEIPTPARPDLRRTIRPPQGG